MINWRLATNGNILKKDDFVYKWKKKNYSIAEDRSFKKLKQIEAFGPYSLQGIALFVASFYIVLKCLLILVKERWPHLSFQLATQTMHFAVLCFRSDYPANMWEMLSQHDIASVANRHKLAC